MATCEDEMRLKHLEHIQGVITRLAQNSFAIRGWSVSLISVVLAIVAGTHSGTVFAPVALVPIGVFWGLDAYYLRRERLFRCLYADAAHRLIGGLAATGDIADLPPFDMDISRYSSRVPNYARTLVAPSVLTIPAMNLLGVLAYRVSTL